MAYITLIDGGLSVQKHPAIEDIPSDVLLTTMSVARHHVPGIIQEGGILSALSAQVAGEDEMRDMEYLIISSA